MAIKSKLLAIKLLLVLILALVSINSFAIELASKQPIRALKNHAKVSFFGGEEGLEQFNVLGIVEDHNGFLWLATHDGIVRFDGTHFKNINSKESGLSHNAVSSLYVDSKQRLWVGTVKGLNLYSESTEKFTSYEQDGLLDSHIWSIYEDSKHRLLVSTTTGLHVFDEAKQRFEALNFPLDNQLISPKEIKTIYDFDGQFIWLGADENNYLLDTELNNLYSLSKQNPLGIQLKNQVINHILPRDQFRLILISDRAVFQYESGQLTTLIALDDNDLSKMHRGVFDDDGRLWISSTTGLKHYSFLDNSISVVTDIVATQPIYGVFKDSNGTVWFGSQRNGLGSHTKSHSLFKHLSSKHNNLSDDVVWGINEDNEKNVWVSGQSNILNRINLSSGTIEDFDSNVLGDKAIAFDKYNHMYAGGMFGLYQYDISAADFSASRKMITQKDVAYITSVDDYIYLGAWGDGLYRFNVKEENSILESISFEDESLSYITTLNAHQGQLYVGQLDGLMLIDVERGLVREIPEFEGLRVSYIHIDPSGVFLSTGSNGVYHFNHGLTQLITHYNSDELLSKTIYAVLKGAQGNLWLSTNKGVLQIDANGKIKSFDTSDGLQALDFNDNSALLSRDGMIFLGGMYGLNYFNSHDEDANEHLSPKLLFTDLTVFNKPVAIGPSQDNVTRIKRSIIHAPDIVLNYSDYPFELTFNLVNFPQPHKVKYQYKVDGIDSDWIDSKKTQTATYTNLNFGHYTLQVRAFHNNSPKAIASTQIAIEVLPPLWLSKAALFLYVMFTVLVSVVVYRVLRQRKLTGAALKESAERLELSLWGSGDMMWDWDIKQQQMHLTQDWQQFDYLGLNDETFSKIHPNDREVVKEKLRSHLTGEEEFFEANYRICRHDNPEQWIWIVDRAKVVERSETGQAERITGTIRDITKFKDAELKLNLQASVMANISDAIYVLDLDFNVVDINLAFSEITGLGSAQVLGNKRIFNTYNGSTAEHIKKRLRSGIDWSGEVIASKPDGDQYHIDLTVNPMRDADNEISHYVAAFSDITKRKETEEELRHLSNIDPLTNLPNRSYFQYAHRNLIRRKEPHALLTMDVDNFKKVNDSMGHEIGDKLLCMIAERIENNVDCQHLLCRLGGDEFALLLEDIDQISMITQVLYDIEVSMQEPFYLGDQVLVMSSSIGVAIYPNDGESTETMLQSSDTAMYHAKSEPGFSYQFFSSSMNDSAVRRLQVESMIRQALKNDWFEVYYQPKIDVKTRKIAGMEALVRLIHPELGMISPNEFIPIAEDTGLVIAIGEKVLDKACYATQQWRKSGLFNGRVAVNLAAKQFTQSNLLERVEHILECTQLPIANLEFEITEGTVIEEPEKAIETMKQLTDKGIHLALDDFGTGYSSLSYLKRFPIHTLKIDKAFIDDLSVENGERHMVASIISIAHNMGLSVVAEGVEHEEQVALLSDLHCETIQGFYFSRPLSEIDFTSFLLKQSHQQQHQLTEG